MNDPGTIVIVAAMPEELAGVREGADARELELDGVEAAWRGRRGGRDLLLAATGDGAIAAERGLAAALSRGRCERLWAIGIAGGLSPDLGAAEVVEAGRVLDTGSGEAFYPAGAGSEALGTVVHSDRVLVTPAEKAELWRRAGEPGRAVADLETFTWARMAADRGLPWRALRAVSDTAGERLPLDFNRFRDEEGSIRRDRVATHIAARPLSWPALKRLRDRVAACGRELGARLLAELDR